MGKKSKVNYNIEEGALVTVFWRDIVGDITGKTDDADYGLCISVGFFVARKKISGRFCIVVAETKTRYTLTEREEWYGYNCYPIEIVDRIEVLRKSDYIGTDYRKQS